MISRHFLNQIRMNHLPDRAIRVALSGRLIAWGFLVLFRRSPRFLFVSNVKTRFRACLTTLADYFAFRLVCLATKNCSWIRVLFLFFRFHYLAKMNSNLAIPLILFSRLDRVYSSTFSLSRRLLRNSWWSILLIV